MRYEVWSDVPVGVEIAGCLAEAQGCNQRGCLLGTGTAGSSYPGDKEKTLKSLLARARSCQCC